MFKIPLEDHIQAPVIVSQLNTIRRKKSKKKSSKKKVDLSNIEFKNAFISYCKGLDMEVWVGQQSTLKQLQKHGKKTPIIEILDLLQHYLDLKVKS